MSFEKTPDTSNYSAIDDTSSLDESGSLLGNTTTPGKHRKPVVVAGFLAALCLVFFSLGVVSRGGGGSNGSVMAGGRGEGSVVGLLPYYNYDDDLFRLIMKDGECTSLSNCQGHDYLVGCEDYQAIFDDEGITVYDDDIKEKLYGRAAYDFGGTKIRGTCIAGDPTLYAGDPTLYCNDVLGNRLVTLDCDRSGFDKGSCNLCQVSTPF